MPLTTAIAYKAFGMNLLSEIPLPELPQIPGMDASIDVTVTRADLSSYWVQPAFENEVPLDVNEAAITFQIPDTAIFRVEEGQRILVSPLPLFQEDKARLYILGTCLGAILLQRRILPLHGSALVINGKVYAIVGDSGAGKSTLASVLIQKGYKLLSDDVIAVSFSNEGIPFVFPAYPQQKLWQESLTQLDMESADFRPLIERETKYAVPVQENFLDTPLPLAGIFELNKLEEDNVSPSIQEVQGLAQLPVLLHHTYRNLFIRKAGLLDWHFQFCTKLTGYIDIFKLQRPVGRFTAHELAELILNTIQKES